MSDSSGGEGWWQASDGKWYPPEAHPNFTGANTGTSPKPRNPWRRFRGWPLWAQIVSWVALALVVLGAIGAATGEDTSSKNISTDKATTTTAAPTTTPPPTTAAPTTTLSPATPLPPSTIPPPTAPGSPPSTTALLGLATLPVKGRAPMTGYSRAQFGPAWTDDVTVADGHNGCDTRNDILRRDLSSEVIKPGTHGCTVASGVLHDPYTNTVINFTRGVGTSTVIQIDHVVALGDAWQTGAQQLSTAVRTNLANDPLELLAVSGPVNEQKGDADAASWLPPNKAFRCSYVATQVAVKVKYHLWVTSAERAAVAQVLSTCPTQPLPTGGPPAASSPTTVALPNTVPPVAPTPPPTAAPGLPPPPGAAGCHPVTSGGNCYKAGQFCPTAYHGASGIASNGQSITCRPSGTRWKWQAS